MKKILLKFISYVLILGAILAGLILFNLNFPADNALVIAASLGEDRPAISQIGPPPRQKLENDDQLILDSPVYFDVRTLPWFKQARIELIYQEGERKLIELGGQVGPGWQYYLVKPVSVISLADGWQKATFYFDLQILLKPKNMTRFLISTSGQPQDQLKIKALTVTLLR